LSSSSSFPWWLLLVAAPTSWTSALLTSWCVYILWVDFGLRWVVATVAYWFGLRLETRSLPVRLLNLPSSPHAESRRRDDTHG
jgi:hypothetical protein